MRSRVKKKNIQNLLFEANMKFAKFGPKSPKYGRGDPLLNNFRR